MARGRRSVGAARVLRSCVALMALYDALYGASAPASATRLSAAAVRGVAPEQQQRYLSQTFECVVRGETRALGIELVNDDYCDCDNGEDEPGTSACSHLISSVFYCGNDGYFPKKIPTSCINDGVCDCCDGTDEFHDAALCVNTCATEAVTFRQAAKEKLAAVEAGFHKRQAVINGEIKEYFDETSQAQIAAKQTLQALEQLKARVVVHKDREELKEKKLRLDLARKAQAQSDGADAAEKGQQANSETEDKSECIPGAASGKTCEDEKAGESVQFEEVDASELVEDAEEEEEVETAGATAPHDLLSTDEETEIQRVRSEVELADGTHVSLSEYLRLDRHFQPSKKLKGSRKTPDQMRREDFLGPLFNGDAQGRKRIGLYALRTLGVLCSPVRGVVELVLFIPHTLWDLYITIFKPDLSWLPSLSVSSVVQTPWFRRLGEGQVYRGYQHAAWSAQVAWDAPVFVYNYLFPSLDESVISTEAESLRRVLREIDEDIRKLETERDEKHKAAEMDFGPERAFFALQDECVEKKIEKYTYKFCAFKDVKQDYTLLGKWDKWGSKDGTSDYTRMQFTKGQKCWNGPERSVQVQLECGEENEIVAVEEPSTCEYEMTVRSPLACTQEELARAQQEFAFWSKNNRASE